MVFVGIYRAIYDYAPQADNELAITDGDLVFVLEKESDGDWWKVKRKAGEDEEDEPEGLVPSNYIEEAQPLHTAKALYDYSRQTDEELSFHEEALLEVYDQTDPDWTLVGYNGEFGFAPSNYIGPNDTRSGLPSRAPAAEESFDDHDSGFTTPAESPMQSPAAALAGIIQQRTGGPSTASVMSPPRASTYTPDASDEEDAPPSLPRRPQGASPISYDKALPQAPGDRGSSQDQYNVAGGSSGFRMYNIHEMISHMGRNRKMPTVFGLNVPQGRITVSSESTGSQEWTAEKLTHYSLEGKHVFVELVRPSKSIDFHAGNKDTAMEIVSLLGELAGAVRAGGMREVLAISNGTGAQKKGHMLYEFMAQGDDEVTVAVGDEVIVLDDTQSEEWWRVRRLKNGKEGVVPSSYVDLTGGGTSGGAGASTATVSSPNGANGYSNVEQNRRDEERMTMEAVKTATQPESSKKDRRRDSKAAGSAKPDMARVRQWTDRSGSFKVDAEFLGMKDGKIHLHKTNGVKIAVPAAKMSVEDIEYVERATGHSLDEEKPLSELKRQNEQRRNDRVTSPTGATGAAVEAPAPPSYDWFDFFLQCGCAPQICERYAQAFSRDQMSEENLTDVNPGVLRTLGLKEGDILRVMKHLDSKFGRVRPPLGSSNSSTADGLFSGPEGLLRNNTSKGRPAPPVETNNTVDPKMFEQNNSRSEGGAATPITSAPPNPARTASGFDDDAWSNKPPTQTSMPPPAQPQRPAVTGAMELLSLSSPPLQPTPAPQPVTSQPLQQTQGGADPSFFDQLARPSQTPQTSAPRQRPQPPQQMNSIQSGLPPPPMKPMSAPGMQPYTTPGPMQSQITGMPGGLQYQQPPLGFNYPQSNGQILPQITGYPQNMMQQPLQPLQPQPTSNQFIPNQVTGYPGQMPYQPAPYLTYQQTGSPFADPPRAPFIQSQPTGYGQSYIQPQPTGYGQAYMQPQVTGINNYTNGFGQPSQLPPMQPQQTQGSLPPLIPQKTGPAPPIRFGMTPAPKLTPQMTGRRANLQSATPQNPFGF